MPTTNGTGPKCPHPTRLHELIDLIEQDKELDAGSNSDLLDALDWLATMLENRALYHKKQNIKKRIIVDLAREAGLIDQANALTRDALHDFVSKQEPDKDEFEIDIESDRR
jgi:hypothetical protein